MRFRLQAKAVLFFGLLMATCLGVVLIEVYRSQSQVLSTDAEQHFMSAGRIVADEIFRNYEIDDWRGLESCIQHFSMNESPHVLAAAVLDSTGDVIVASRPQLTGHRLWEPAVREVVARKSAWNSINRSRSPWTIEILSPVTSESAKAPVKAVVYIVGSLQSVQDELNSNFRHQILIFVAVTVVGILGTLIYMRRGIVNPVRQLYLATQRVVAGDFRESNIRKTRDELGELTAAFDWMTSELRRSDEFLKGYNQSLMQMVAAEQDRNRLDRIISSIAYALIEIDHAGNICRWNKAATEIFGLSHEAVIGRPLRDSGISWDWDQVEELVGGEMDDNQSWRREGIAYVRPDGSRGYLTLTTSRIGSAGAEWDTAQSVYVLLAADMTQRKLAEERVEKSTRTLNTINRCRNAIVRATEVPVLLQDVCQILVDVSGYRLVWVGLIEPAGEKIIRPAASAGVDDGLLDQIRMTWGFGEHGLGAAAHAIRSGNPQVVRNLAADPDFVDSAEECRARGYAAAIVLPLAGDHGPIGILSIYAAEAAAFDSGDELRLLVGLADNLAHSVGAIRAHEETKQVSENLEKSLSLMHATLESTADGILGVDLKGRIVTYNRRFMSMWNAPQRLLDSGRANHLARFVLEQLAHPKEFLAKIRVLNENPDSSGWDVVELKDGRVFERYSQPQHSNGRPVGRIWSFRDVTQRRIAERKLQASEEYHRALIDNTSDIVIVLNSDGSFRYLSSSVQRRLGYSPDELVGRHFSDVIDEGDQPASLAGFEQILSDPQSIVTLELRAKHKDGSTRLLEVSGRNLLDESRISGIIVNAHDITERRESEVVQDRLAAAVEQASESILIFDAAGIVNYANPAFEWISGLSLDQVIGSSVESLLTLRGHDQASARSILGVIERAELWRGRLASRRAEGLPVHEDATITPVCDQSGKIANYVWVSRDITQQVVLESQLHQAQKLEAVGSLAAGIAHEINTPIQFVGDNVRFLSDSFEELTALLQRIEALMNTLSSHPETAALVREFTEAAEAADLGYLREEVPRAVAQTLDGVARVAKIVRAMKDFSHPDQGQKGPADINRAILSTLTVAHNELKYVADVVTDLDENLPSVECHLSDLNQVLLNLLVNAAHAIAGVVGDGGNGKGTITVRTRATEKQGYPGQAEGVIISITDTGTGIPENIRDRVFEQFFTTKEVGRGTGQGLAIARAVVVDKHGGRIWFETEVGKGTTFNIYLPVEVEEIAEAT